VAIHSGGNMRIVSPHKRCRWIAYTILVSTFAWVALCPAQDLRIASLDGMGNMGFVLRDTGSVTSFVCTVEWCSSLGDGWTNAWYRPFSEHTPSNGLSTVKLPRFFRLVCDEGTLPTNETQTVYDVIAVVPSGSAAGTLSWQNTDGTGTTYHVEYATAPSGPWRGDWGLSTNVLTPTAVTNYFGLPLYFRAVTIKANDGGEIPW